jgi:Flp pilus assembly pilin Flp
VDTLQSRSKKAGQGMTEYIVIVALIAVAAIATYQFFGQTIRNQMAGIANEVAGESAEAARQAARTAASSAQTQEGGVKGLDHYMNDNARGGGQ